MSETYLSIVLPWFILFLLIITAIIFTLKIPDGFRRLMKLPHWAKAALVIAVGLGAWIRFTYVPLEHRIYYDEDRYLSYAVTFARFGKAVTVDLATLQKSILGIPDDAIRTTVPVLNAVILRTTGYSEHNLFIAAKYFSSIQIILLFIVGLLLTENPLVATIGAFGMAFLPSNIFWSVSIGLDGYFVFFTLLSMVAALLLAKKPTLENNILFASSTFLLLCVRLESFLFLFVLLATIALKRNENNKPLIFKTDLPTIIIFTTLILLRAGASISVLGKKWCCAEALPLEAFSFSYMVRNILPNLLTLFTLAEFPFIITLFAGGALISRPQFKLKVVLLIWVAAYFFIYSFYYAGVFFSPEFSGSYGRYFLMLIPPLLLLAGIGINELIINLRRKKKNVTLGIGAVIVILSMYPTFWNYASMIRISPYDKNVDAGPRNLHQFMEKKLVPATPRNSIIVHNLTGYILLNNRTVIFSGTLVRNKIASNFMLNALKQGLPVYMIFPYDCELFPEHCSNFYPYIDFKPFLNATNTTPAVSQVFLKKKK